MQIRHLIILHLNREGNTQTLSRHLHVNIVRHKEINESRGGKLAYFQLALK